MTIRKQNHDQLVWASERSALQNKVDDLNDIIKDLRSFIESAEDVTDPDTGYTWKQLYEVYRRNFIENEMKLYGI